MKSLLKTIKSFGFAWKGIVYVLKHENNMRFHIIASIVVILAGYFVKLSQSEWIAIILSIGFVCLAELFNTALEKLVDMGSPEFNEKAGLVKDIAAGAVLIASLTAFIVGLIVFAKYIF